MMKTPIQNLGYLILRSLVSKEYNNVLGRRGILEVIHSSLADSITRQISVPDAISKIFRNPVFQSGSSNVIQKYSRLEDYLKSIISSDDGLKVFYNIAKFIGPLTNQMVKEIPARSANIAQPQARQELLDRGDDAIEDLISNWDTRTYHACMIKESSLCKELMDKISSYLDSSVYPLNEELRKYLVCGAIQEFERRASQKRKQRAGDDLHVAVQTIFEHIGVDLDPVPQQMTGILEADHVIRFRQTMCIVSCKRTGRERVRQVSVSRDELASLRIKKIIWFMTEFDQSHQRVVDLGVRGSIFYLPDRSPIYRDLRNDEATAQYVLPISGIRTSIQQILRGEQTDQNV